MSTRRATRGGPGRPQASPVRGRARAAAPAPPAVPGGITTESAPAASGPITMAALEAQVAALTAALQAERARHARQVAALRREADRKLAAMASEISTLRHHEARAALLARRLRACEAMPASAPSQESTIHGEASRSTGR